jgi:hypothetical protein
MVVISGRDGKGGIIQLLCYTVSIYNQMRSVGGVREKKC